MERRKSFKPISVFDFPFSITMQQCNDATTPRLLGVLGYPVKHSLSPIIFNAAFKAADIQADYRAFEVRSENLKKFIKEVRERPIDGLSVTLPHKEKIIEFLDEIDADATAIGAINTVKNEHGTLKGYNTDWLGARKALEDMTSLRGKPVAVLGAGGSARAVIYACQKAGAKVVIFNRTFEKARQLAKHFSVQADQFINFSKHQPEIVINTTSLGMAPYKDKTILSKKYFNKNMVVMDLVYNPEKTRFLKEAAEAGCKIIPGTNMFLSQAQEQFRIWFGKKDFEAG
jgi:shikimate dehydrogenase